MPENTEAVVVAINAISRIAMCANIKNQQDDNKIKDEMDKNSEVKNKVEIKFLLLYLYVLIFLIRFR